MSKKSINVGIIGFGTVGTGTARILIENAEMIRRRLGEPVILKKISDLDIKRDRGIKLKGTSLTTSAQEIIADPDIDIVVELIGGYKPAKEFILEAIKNKKHVVTANKALLAVHGEEIYAAAEKAGVTLGYEASVAGGIPILAAIRNGLAANNIKSIYGIVNGTCNYILTLMTNAGRKFDEVLKEAQAMGYAEADPTFDIEGIDSAHKLAVLTMLAYRHAGQVRGHLYRGHLEDHAAGHRFCKGTGLQDQASGDHQDGERRGRGAGASDHAARDLSDRHRRRRIQCAFRCRATRSGPRCSTAGAPATCRRAARS